MRNIPKYLCITVALAAFLSLAAHIVMLGIYALGLLAFVVCGFIYFYRS